MNRYIKPEKHAALEAALVVTAGLPALALMADGTQGVLARQLVNEHGLSEPDAWEVAAKALRVERGKRIRPR